MSGFDKFRMCELLKEHGWIEVEENRFVPPDSLWQNKPKSFHVYEAIDLQNFIGKEEDMSDDFM